MTSATTLPVIEYARGDVPFHRRRRWIMLVASLPAVVVPFAPFVWDVSPLAAVRHLFDDGMFDTLALALLCLGFCAALVGFAWRALLLRRPEPGRAACVTFLVISTPFWAATLWVNCLWCRSAIEQMRGGSSVIASLAGVWPFAAHVPVAVLALFIAYVSARRGAIARAILIVLTTPFLTTASSCMLGFRDDDWQLGYWLSMYITALWMGELAADGLKLVRGWRRVKS
jgi:hypothetical protein